MPKKTDKSKAKPTVLAQLVAMYAKHEDITETRELADITGFDISHINKAKRELRMRIDAWATSPNCASMPRQRAPIEATSPNQPRARAYKESPYGDKLILDVEKKELCAIDVSATDRIEPPNNPRSNGRNPRASKATTENEKAFEQFWAAFPAGRKRGKGACREKFFRTVKHKQATAEELVQAVLAGNGIDPDFPPMPATWLNQGRWEDDPPKLKQPPENKNSFRDYLAERERRKQSVGVQ